MLKNLSLPLINITGYSGSGKTTFIEKCIPALKQKGYSPAFIKHAGHPHSFDEKGKDTTRQFNAGAVYSSIFSERHWAVQMQGNIDEIMLQSNPTVDIILLEGFKATSYPKVVCVHPESGVPDALHWNEVTENEPLVWAYLTGTEDQAQSINEQVGYGIAFHRDAVDVVVQYIVSRLHWYGLQKATLKGAVFIGGQSSRMGQDKAWLDYGHGPQAHYIRNLMLAHEGIEEVVYSGSERSRFPDGNEGIVVTDRFQNMGPMGGLLTLLDRSPNSAWLVLSCDLANVRAELIETLILRRNPLKLATIFTNPNGRLDVLAAIYEPRIRFTLFRELIKQQYSLQALVKNSAIERIPIPEELASQLVNVNTPKEREQLLNDQKSTGEK